MHATRLLLVLLLLPPAAVHAQGTGALRSLNRDYKFGEVATDAFFDGATLTHVRIPNGVARITNNAFFGCTHLTKVTIPGSIRSIGPFAFLHCTGLTDITVEPSNPVFSSVDGVLFNHRMTSLLLYPAGKGGSYAIPDGVTTIGDDAFRDCTRLTNVTIPGSVTDIGARAFHGCTRLTSVAIPGSVTQIGFLAFWECTGLTNITIPGSVVYLDERAFGSCSNLTAIAVDPRNVRYSSRDGILFDKSQTRLMRYPGGKAGSYAIPDTVTSIADWAFEACTRLTSVTIPNGVKSVGEYTFARCTNLTGVTIPEGITEIEAGAFSGCTRLANIMIPASVTNLGGVLCSAFESCAGLREITVATQNPRYSSLDGVLFDKSQTTLLRCPGGKADSYTVPDGVTMIGDFSFEDCTRLTTIRIPKTVMKIAGTAFLECSALAQISVDPDNPAYASVGGVLFNKSQTTLVKCPGGKTGSYTAPNSVTEIDWHAFSGCSLLSNITIPNSVTQIENFAFKNCSRLTGITLPDSVKSIGRDLFSGCTSLTRVRLPNDLTSMDSHLFYGCTSLTNIAIPERITHIPTDAFNGCSRLVSITIPKGVTSIANDAFKACTNLTTVYFRGNAPRLGATVFADACNAKAHYLPGTTGWGSTFGGLPTVLLDQLSSSSALEGAIADQGAQDNAPVLSSNVTVEGAVEGLPLAETHLEDYKAKAEAGEAAAQLWLGLRYSDGRGVPQDYAQALQWFRKAADQGLARAQFNLGNCYRLGTGVTQDNAEALKWFRKAAEQGFAEAQINLAMCYREGVGVPHDDVQALAWLRKAADQGDAQAQVYLGNFYREGVGTVQDYGEALKWFHKAADQGDAQAQHNLGLCYGEGVITPRNDVEAYVWFGLAAAQGRQEDLRNQQIVAKRMSSEEVMEGQRRVAAFVAKQFPLSGTTPAAQQSIAPPVSETQPRTAMVRGVVAPTEGLTEAELTALTNTIATLIAPFTLVELRLDHIPKEVLRANYPQMSDEQLGEAINRPGWSMTKSRPRLEGGKQVIVYANVRSQQEGRHVEISISKSDTIAGFFIGDTGKKVAVFTRLVRIPSDPIGFSEVWLQHEGETVEYRRTDDGKWVRCRQPAQHD